MSLLRERLLQVRRESLKPPPRLNLVEWADERRYLSPEGAALPGRWKTSRVEVARGPMLAVSDPTIHTVTVMCCTQLLKTELILNIIGYHIDQDPAPMIVVQPTVHMGEAFSKDRVDPMLRDSPALAGKVPPKRQRDSGNTVLHKQFPGGHLTIVGANAPGDLAMRPVRVVLCDEVDKYPESAGKEGDPIQLIRERAATFWNHKFISCCSPTIEGHSRIALEFEAGDQRVFEVPCPHCGHREEMAWKHVKWTDGDPSTALYHCPECGAGWDDVQRRRAIRRGTWRATKPFNGHASFRASKLASPWEADSLAKLVEKWLRSQQSREMLKTFVNTQLAETFKEKGDAPEWQRLYDRRESYQINVPPRVPMILFAGADVQKDRIEVEIVGFGARLQSWSVDYRVFPGDTADMDGPNSPWRQLSNLLSESWQADGGSPMQIRMLAVDAGYNTHTVLGWVRKWPAGRVIAVKGHDTLPVAIGAPKAVDVNTGGQRKKRGAKQWPVGTNLLKTELYGWLKQDRPTDDSEAEYPYGYCHFPQYGDEYFRQLTAEEVVVRMVRGYRRPQWEKTRERNEALDCRVYARAVSVLCGVDRISAEQWEEMAVLMGFKQEAGVAQQATAEAQPQNINGVQVTRRKSDYWSRRR